MDQVSWLSIDEAVFYGLAWATAFFSGYLRSLADDCYKSWRNSIVVGGISGFVGAGVVGILLGWLYDGVATRHWGFICVAAVIGLFSKYQCKLLDLIASYFPAIIKQYLDTKFHLDVPDSEEEKDQG